MPVWPYDYDEEFQEEMSGDTTRIPGKRVLTKQRVADGTFRYVVRTDAYGNRTLTTVLESQEWECSECCPDDDEGGGGGGGNGPCSNCWTPSNPNDYTGFSGSFRTKCRTNPDAHLTDTCARCCTALDEVDGPCFNGNDYGYCFDCGACYADIENAPATICGQTYGFSTTTAFYQTKYIVVGQEVVIDPDSYYCERMQAYLDANNFGNCAWYGQPTIAVHMSCTWIPSGENEWARYVGCPEDVTCEDCVKYPPNSACPDDGECEGAMGTASCGGCNYYGPGRCFGTAYPGDGQFEATTYENWDGERLGSGCWKVRMFAREDCTASKCIEWAANRILCSDLGGCQATVPPELDEHIPGVTCECDCTADAQQYNLGQRGCSHCVNGCSARSEIFGWALLVNKDLDTCRTKPYNLKTLWGWEGGSCFNCGGEEIPCGGYGGDGCIDPDTGEPYPWAACGTPCYHGYSSEAYCHAIEFQFLKGNGEP